MKILSLDDHPIFGEGLKDALSRCFDEFNLINTSKPADALKRLQKEDFDLIILDLCMPEIDGLLFMATLASRKVHVPVVIMSAQDDLKKIAYAISLGAVGFIPKSYTIEEIADALRKIEQGQLVLPNHIKIGLNHISKHAVENTESILSERQIEIIKLVQSGLSNSGIASVLYISETTVKSHLQTMFKILSATNRLDCVRKAEKLRIIPPMV